MIYSVLIFLKGFERLKVGSRSLGIALHATLRKQINKWIAQFMQRKKRDAGLCWLPWPHTEADTDLGALEVSKLLPLLLYDVQVSRLSSLVLTLFLSLSGSTALSIDWRATFIGDASSACFLDEESICSKLFEVILASSLLGRWMRGASFAEVFLLSKYSQAASTGIFSLFFLILVTLSNSKGKKIEELYFVYTNKDNLWLTCLTRHSNH